MRISTVKTRMASVVAFLHFLTGESLIPGTALKRTNPPQAPRHTPPRHEPQRMCASSSRSSTTPGTAPSILLLLRTGIRIGEALGLTLHDLDLKDRKVHLFQGEKNSRGGGYFFDDAPLRPQALAPAARSGARQFLFYGQGDRPPFATAPRWAASRSTSQGQSSPRRDTRSIAFATPWLPSCSTPACISSVSKSFWGIRTSR